MDGSDEKCSESRCVLQVCLSALVGQEDVGQDGKKKGARVIARF